MDSTTLLTLSWCTLIVVCVSGQVSCVVLQETSGRLWGDESPGRSPWQQAAGHQPNPPQRWPAESICHPSLQPADFQSRAWRLWHLHVRLRTQGLLLWLRSGHPGSAHTQLNSKVIRKSYVTLLILNVLYVKPDEPLIFMTLFFSSEVIRPVSLLKPRKEKKSRGEVLVNRCTKSSPVSGPGRCAIAVEYQASRFAWDSAMFTPDTCMYATDGPIRLSHPAARGRCPGLSNVWSEAEFGPSWRSKAVKWRVQLEVLRPLNSMLWWRFWATSKNEHDTHVDKWIDDCIELIFKKTKPPPRPSRGHDMYDTQH